MTSGYIGVFSEPALVMAQSGRDLVLHPAGAVAERCFIYRHQTTAGAHRCLRRHLQRQCRTVRLEKEKSLSAPLQKPPYHSALIQGTRQVCFLPEPDSCATANGLIIRL